MGAHYKHRAQFVGWWCEHPDYFKQQCRRCRKWFEQLYAGGHCEGCLEAIGPDVMACDLDTD